MTWRIVSEIGAAPEVVPPIRNQQYYLDERRGYLEASEAGVVPAGVYALWLYAYRESGGVVTHQRGELPRIDTPFVVRTGGLGYEERDASGDPYSHGSVMWQPTVNPGMRIPAGYGTAALDLLVLPDLAPIDLTPPIDTKDKYRKFGHTTIKVLALDDSQPLGYRVETNNPEIVETFTDVEPLWRNYTTNPIDVRQTLEKMRLWGIANTMLMVSKP